MDEETKDEAKDQIKVVLIKEFDEYKLEHSAVLKIIQSGFLVEDDQNSKLMIGWQNSNLL